MSPIIYSDHPCGLPRDVSVMPGDLWQCDTCQKVWAKDSAGWSLAADPRRDAALRAACAQPAPSTTPRITPDMVQLVVDAYKKHNDTVTRGGRHYCKECDEYLEGSLDVLRHDRTRGRWALEYALGKADPAQPAPSTTPRVTPGVVQLALDTYTDHMSAVPNDVGTDALGFCGECGKGMYGHYTIQIHAREKAAAALQSALAAGEPR